MIRTMSGRASVALALLTAAPAAGHAQSAAQYNRAAQAMQICASAVGAALPECAALRAAVGAPAVSAADASAAANLLSGLMGRGSAPVVAPPVTGGAAAGNLFGMAAQAFAASRQQPVVAPAPGSSDYYVGSANAIQNATANYHACVARAGPANPAGVQSCIAQLQAASTGVPAPGATPQTSAAAQAAVSAFSSLLGR